MMRNFITCKVIKSRWMRFARNVARMGVMGKSYKILVEKT
jgi:hypothetical protein